MNKTDTGLGLGLAVALAICCGAHLLILSAAVSGLALLTGQTVVIAAAAVLILGAIGAYVWRWRSRECGASPCSSSDRELQR